MIKFLRWTIIGIIFTVNIVFSANAQIATQIVNTANAFLTFGHSNASSTNTTGFFGSYGLIASGEIFASVPRATVISNMYITTVNAPTGVQTNTYTLRKNGADTALTCTITGVATTCNDTTHSVSYAAGDTIGMKFVPSVTAAVTFNTAVMQISATN